MRELVLASHNRGKLAELTALLADLPLAIAGAAEHGVSEPVEDGITFVENALIKARHAARTSGRAALADDSGLVVDALGGAPGVYSARYAGAGAGDAANLEKLLLATEHLHGADRQCQFVCVIVVVARWDDPLPLIAQGVWNGRLLRVPRGSGGFGYDPIFADAATGRGAAEMTPHEKAQISHRGRALMQLKDRIVDKLGGA